MVAGIWCIYMLNGQSFLWPFLRSNVASHVKVPPRRFLEDVYAGLSRADRDPPALGSEFEFNTLGGYGLMRMCDGCASFTYRQRSFGSPMV